MTTVVTSTSARSLSIASMLVAACTLIGCSQQSTDADIQSQTSSDAARSSIRIATEGAYPPFNYTDNQGNLAGFDVEVANALCDQMQVSCEIVAQDWEGIIPGLMAGKYDAVIAGMSVTPERQEKVDFSEPYFTNTMVWLAKNDGDFDVNAISNNALGGQRSTTLGQYLLDNFDDQNGNSVNLYDTYESAYLDLKSGRVDAVLAEKVSATDFLAQNTDYSVMGDEIDNDDNIAIAVRKNDALKQKFDAALSQIKANGQLASIEQANFGQ